MYIDASRGSPKIKPPMWAIDQGIVAYNIRRAGMPYPIFAMPLWEGAGNFISDISGYNNHWTINFSGLVNSQQGYVLEFNGSSDYVNCGNDPSLNFGTDSFSTSFWFKGQPTGWKEIIGKRGDASHYWGCFDGGTNYKMRWKLQGDAVTSVVATQPEVVFNNEWCHAVWIVDRIQHKVIWYFDGVKSTTETDISSLAGLTFDSTSPVRIGRTDTANGPAR